MPSTVSSIPVRMSRRLPPVRAASPVIRPSRGPGPKMLPMYAAPASPFSTNPPASRAIRAGNESGAGITASPRSAAMPITKTLATVPSPGHCRSGIHSSNTMAPTMMVTMPKLNGR